MRHTYGSHSAMMRTIMAMDVVDYEIKGREMQFVGSVLGGFGAGGLLGGILGGDGE